MARNRKIASPGAEIGTVHVCSKKKKGKKNTSTASPLSKNKQVVVEEIMEPEIANANIVRWESAVLKIFPDPDIPFLSDIKDGLEFPVLDQLIDFLERKITSSHDFGKYIILCERRFQIDRFALLLAVLRLVYPSIAASNPDDPSPLSAFVSQLEKLNTTTSSSSRLLWVYEPFTYFKETLKKQCVLDPLNIIDNFRLTTNLKGKKNPLAKKNFDAQLIVDREAGYELLKQSKDYFNCFKDNTEPAPPYELGDLGSEHILALANHIFLLPCRPGLIEKGGQVSSYYDAAYINLTVKSKIRKVPEVMTLGARTTADDGGRDIDLLVSFPKSTTWLGASDVPLSN